MKKFKLTLFALCAKDYVIEAKDRDDAELKAIEDFKKNCYSDILEEECYARFERS
jgi:hypothetical protein